MTSVCKVHTGSLDLGAAYRRRLTWKGLAGHGSTCAYVHALTI
jgi:hypothetical protein